MSEASNPVPKRLSVLSGWLDWLFSVVVGVTIALGQSPFDYFWLSLPAMSAALALGLSSLSPNHAAKRGFAIGIGFASLTFIWITEPFLVDVQTHGWMAPFALLFMASGVAVFWASAFYWARRFAGAGTVSLLLALCGFWTAAEILRSYILTGFPWGLTSYIWIDTPVYQLAAFVGPHGLTLWTVLLVAAATIGVLNRAVWPAISATLLLTASWFGGSFLQIHPVTETVKSGPIVRLIQPNASQDQKWDPAMMPVFYNRQLSLTAEPADAPLDLIIWPEVAVPFLISEPTAPFWEISAAANGVPVVVGAQRLDGNRAFNSMAVLGPSGEISQIYDKHHLVPFGEYLPAGDMLDRVGLKALSAQYGIGYSPGPGTRILDLGRLGKVLPLICYEAIFPHELRRASERPDWMLMVTNDAWFGNKIGPFQHLAQARARAIELRMPMVRAANTGVSAVIDAKGHIVNSLPLAVSGHLDVAIPLSLSPSLYWRFGDIPAILALIVLGMAAFAARGRNSIDHPRQHS